MLIEINFYFVLTFIKFLFKCSQKQFNILKPKIE